MSNADNVKITVGLGAFALQRDLDGEETTRENADKTLQKNIDAEKSARENADNDFTQQLNSEKTAREQGDSAAKTYADGAVKTAIDELVNGAPGDMDTIRELADAMKENGDALEALREISGGKASTSDLTAHKEKIASVSELGHLKLYNRSGVNASGILVSEDGSVTVNVDNRHGLYRSGAGQITTAAASEEDIAAKTDEYKPIVPARLGYIFTDTALTGTPTAPTPGATDSSTRVATTEFVNSVIAGATGEIEETTIKYVRSEHIVQQTSKSEYFTSSPVIQKTEGIYYRVKVDNYDSLYQSYDDAAGSVYAFYIDNTQALFGRSAYNYETMGSGMAITLECLNNGVYYLTYSASDDKFIIDRPLGGILPRLAALEAAVYQN